MLPNKHTDESRPSLARSVRPFRVAIGLHKHSGHTQGLLRRGASG
jgi:hypothetical protein